MNERFAVPAVGAIIEKEENGTLYLLMQTRQKENDHGTNGLLEFPAGKVREYESLFVALRREVKEETGLMLKNYRFRGIITFVTDGYETEYMCLYTSDDFEGELLECIEGDLEWVPKSKLRELNLWEGDYIFLELLEKTDKFFSLKLCYEKDKLVEAVLDGETTRKTL